MSLSLWWVVLSASNMEYSPVNAAYRISGSSPEDLLTGAALSNSAVVEVVSSRRSSLSPINLFAPGKAEEDDPFTPTWRVLSTGEENFRSGLDLVTKAAHTSDLSELSQSRDWPDEPLIFLWWFSPVTPRAPATTRHLHKSGMGFSTLKLFDKLTKALSPFLGLKPIDFYCYSPCIRKHPAKIRNTLVKIKITYMMSDKQGKFKWSSPTPQLCFGCTICDNVSCISVATKSMEEATKSVWNLTEILLKLINFSPLDFSFVEKSSQTSSCQGQERSFFHSSSFVVRALPPISLSQGGDTSLVSNQRPVSAILCLFSCVATCTGSEETTEFVSTKTEDMSQLSKARHIRHMLPSLLLFVTFEVASSTHPYFFLDLPDSQLSYPNSYLVSSFLMFNFACIIELYLSGIEL